PSQVRNDSPRPVPGATTPMAPFETGCPAFNVLTSLGRRMGIARATASRSFIRRTDLRLRSFASEISSITQGKLVIFTRPSMTGPSDARPGDVKTSSLDGRLHFLKNFCHQRLQTGVVCAVPLGLGEWRMRPPLN